ncbi:MAG TPA: alpha/beta fold hydrolase [Acidimicrobiales bacterium]|nr:alpha/beta fold hydrolase [Acidimicrobiales bacterium]
MRVRGVLAALVAAVSLLVVAPGASPAEGQVARDPVIIVAGTFADQPAADLFYAPLAARLRADGYSPHIFGLPTSGTQDIGRTAQALNAFADQVRARTGAARVDLIGHSQGGLVARHYVKNLGGSSEVDAVISLGAPHYGTSIANLARLFGFGNCIGIVSCQQMARGSTYLANLNAGDDTIGDVRYTNIISNNDGIVLPVTTGWLANDGNNVNVRVQSPCFLRFVGHVGFALDGTVYSGIQDALANRAIRLNCFAL